MPLSFRIRSSHRLLSALLLAGFICSLASCGPPGIPTVPVKGKITFGGGEWPKPATLDFAMVQSAAGMPNTPASVVVQADGAFNIKLVPGQYVVNLTCQEIEMQPDNPNSGKSFIPDRYRIGADRPKA